jgi:uncharacterized protein YgiM (DUF1202 family)
MKRKLMIMFLLLSLIIGTVTQVAFAAGASQLAIPHLVVNTSFLNVRSGDGPQYSVVAIVVGGTELPVLGTNGSNSWYLVATAVGPGWVDVTYTLPRGDFRNVPVLDPAANVTPVLQTPLSIGLVVANTAPPIAGAAQTTANVPVPIPVLGVPHVVINTSFQNVRTGPGPQFGVVAVVPGGTKLDVIGVNGDTSWYQVRGTFGQGWVASAFVIFRGMFSNVPVIQTAF